MINGRHRQTDRGVGFKYYQQVNKCFCKINVSEKQTEDNTVYKIIELDWRDYN